ncbi:uncharacterized protein LOC126618707 isoform X1 [Malus sylvestris]|uniref:uncharacterized protein LOC126618707 isoform X1 n=1 Tax=Malus sylvestris TaxID=3752 RepID=UPI0021AD0061|nr:uncharacterized protein LOC126618707 isoform X1 [Malus sylvestris]
MFFLLIYFREPQLFLGFPFRQILQIFTFSLPISSQFSNFQIHRDQESGKILNLVFVWANEGSELKVDVSVVFKEESEEKQEALLVATASLFSLSFLCVRGWIFTECGRMNWKGKGQRWVRIRKRKDELQK